MGGTIKLGKPKDGYAKWLDWMIPEIRNEFDSLPRMYGDKTVFVIGGGPSVKSVNLKLIHKRPVVGCNDAFRLGTWVDWCVFADKRWWLWNWEELAQWPNRERAVCIVPQLLDGRAERWPWLKILRRDEARFGLSVEPDTLCWNRGCGGTAINMAYLLGASRIVLIGFDMRMVKGQHNYHDHHQKEERPQIYQNSMRPFLKPMSDAMKVTGLQIVNATPGSALDVFPIMSLEEVLEMGW
jgi:hypothetical protein